MIPARKAHNEMILPGEAAESDTVMSAPA